MIDQGRQVASGNAVTPTYLNECGSKVSDRGPANALSAAFVIGGVPLAYWIDYGFCAFALPAGVVAWYLPDTLRWYYARGRLDEEDATLAALHDTDVSSDIIQETRRQIMVAINVESEASESVHWHQFLTMGITDHTRIKVIRRLVICFWIPMFGEWMGISLLGYFAPVILQGIGISEDLISVLSGVLSTCSVLGTIPVYWTIERFGRRSIMLYTAAASTVFYCVYIAMVSRGGSTESWVAIVLLFVINPIQTYGWQATKFLYTSEIAPLEYRHIGGSMFASGEWLMVFITVFACPIGLDSRGWTFWFFILAGNICAVIFVFLFCPETGGKSLEDIDFVFMGTGLAGLRKNTAFTIHDVESKAEAVHGEEKSVN